MSALTRHRPDLLVQAAIRDREGRLPHSLFPGSEEQYSGPATDHDSLAAKWAQVWEKIPIQLRQTFNRGSI